MRPHRPGDVAETQTCIFPDFAGFAGCGECAKGLHTWPFIVVDGRAKGTRNRASIQREAEIKASGLTPLDYMLDVMRNKRADPARRGALLRFVPTATLGASLLVVAGFLDGTDRIAVCRTAGSCGSSLIRCRQRTAHSS